MSDSVSKFRQITVLSMGNKPNLTLINKFTKMIAEKNKTAKAALGTAVGVVVVGLITFTYLSHLAEDLVREAYPGIISSISEKINAIQATNNLGPRSIAFAQKYQLKDFLVSDSRVVIDTEDKNLADIIGKLSFEYLGDYGINPLKNDYVRIFNFYERLKRKENQPFAFTRMDSESGLSVCFLVAGKQLKPDAPRGGRVGGAMLSYFSEEEAAFIRHHEEAHCLDVIQKDITSKEIFADLVASFQNVAITGNFEFTKNMTIPLRSLSANDYEHQSSGYLRVMMSKIDVASLFGKNEKEVLDLAIIYMKENPVILSEIKKYNDLISAISQIDGSAIRKNGDEIRYTLIQDKDGKGSPVYAYASDQEKIELASLAKVLLQDYVNRMTYEGGLDTPQFNETVLNISSKIARLEGDHSTQYEIQNKQFSASGGINFNVKPFLLRNGINVSLSIENARNINDRMIIAYNKNNEKIIDGMSNVSQRQYASLRRKAALSTANLNDLDDNINALP